MFESTFVFEALQGDWEVASAALAQAEAAVSSAVAEFHRTASNVRLKQALQVRLRANHRIRRLVDKVWSATV
jgi:hypothetical protein